MRVEKKYPVLVCKNFYVDEYEGCLFPVCKELIAITVVCDPFNPECACPFFIACVREFTVPELCIKGMSLAIIEKTLERATKRVKENLEKNVGKTRAERMLAYIEQRNAQSV